MLSDTLYRRLGGYDAIVAVVDDLLARLKAMRNSAASGNTGGKMASFARGSC